MRFSRYTRLSTLLALSGGASIFVAVLVYFGVRKPEVALIAMGLTFIVVLVGIATMALLVPDEDHDPDKPVLS